MGGHNMDLIDKKIMDYINEVDSISPAPGGGSVASLVGALGVSLAKMLGHFSIDKKKFKEANEKKRNQFVLSLKELDYYKDLLIKGVDDDAISYHAVMMAFKSKDAQAIQNALNTSAMIAFEMQEASYKALQYSEKLIELGNKNLYSDLISSAILLHSCNEMAALNVKANANSLVDEELKNKYIQDSLQFILKSRKMKNKILKEIENMN